MIEEWINNRLGTSFKTDDLTYIKEFSLLWNIFERTVCNNHCTVSRLEERLRPIDFDLAEFNEEFGYFRERYITENDTNEKFERLNFRGRDKKNLVANVLLGKETSTSNIVLSLAIIVFRYRNNLFHGLKNILFINEQKTNFFHANQVLIKILNRF